MNQAEDDAPIVRHDAHVPAALAHPVSHGADALVDPARWSVSLRDIGHEGRTGLRALAGQPRGEPVSLPRLITWTCRNPSVSSRDTARALMSHW